MWYSLQGTLQHLCNSRVLHQIMQMFRAAYCFVYQRGRASSWDATHSLGEGCPADTCSSAAAERGGWARQQ